MRSILPLLTVVSLTLPLNVVSHGLRAEDTSLPLTENKPLTWRRVVHLQDGRSFVSDGAFALDLALVKPLERPKQNLGEASAKVVERYLEAQLPNEYSLSELTRRGEAYAAPNGVTLNPTYIEYLRRTLPESRL